jgi:hypothetical protein
VSPARSIRRPAAAVALLLALTAAPAATAAGPGCTGLQPLDGPLGYGARDGATRCEGFFQSPVGAAALEVVFVRYDRLRFDAPADRVLVVRPPGELPPGVERLTVSALALSPQTYYRMDAVLGADDALRWPIAAVLAPAGLGAGDIGVFGAVRAPDRTIHVPLRVAPEGTPPPGPDAPVRLGLRAATELEQVMWRAQGGEGPTMPWAELSADPLFAGDVVELALPPGPSRAVAVELAAMQRATGRWLRRELTVWHAAP